MNVSLNLNYLLVSGLIICIIILIYMLIKCIFVSEQKPFNFNIREKPDEKNLPSNIDFFNSSAKIIDKTNKIVYKENNKFYQIIDLGDKILIMEDTLYMPEEESKNRANEVISSKSFENENENFVPEQISSDIEAQLLNTSDISEVDAMRKIIDDSDIDYDSVQHSLFIIEVNDSINLSEQAKEEQYIKDEENNNFI